MKTLTEQNFEEAAKLLGVSKAVIKAVALVEAAGAGFLTDSRPKILFEAHIFAKYTNGKHNKTHPHISSEKWNRLLYKGGAKEYERLEEAKKLDMEAAYKAASWGKFQIMGFNFKAAGFNSVFEFVEAMWKDEGEHLKAFCNFIKANKSMHAALKRLDWVTFARLYNGPGYAQNNYDYKLKMAYNRYIREEQK